MEIESETGDRISIQSGTAAEIGRLEIRRSSTSSAVTGAGDRTVSRRHLSLRLDGVGDGEPHAEPTVSFEVVGRNPVFVCFGGGRGTRVYRSSEKGMLSDGDRFSLSLKSPLFWAVRRRASGKETVDQSILDAMERRERRTQERRKEKERKVSVEFGEGGGDLEAGNGEFEVELGAVDISGIDPVKEFGFLVKGHEFDSYLRHRVRPAKEWNWFLEVPGRCSHDDDDDDDDNLSGGQISLKRKSKMKRKCEDEEWNVDDVGNVEQIRNERKSMYETRSQGPKKPRKKDLVDKRKTSNVDDNEKDETLGGFIYDNEEESEEEEEEADEEEDEFDEENEETDEEEDEFDEENEDDD